MCLYVVEAAPAQCTVHLPYVWLVCVRSLLCLLLGICMRVGLGSRQPTHFVQRALCCCDTLFVAVFAYHGLCHAVLV